MRKLTIRLLTWYSEHCAADDRGGTHSAEVVMWTALILIMIVGVAGRLDDILNRVVDTVEATLP